MEFTTMRKTLNQTVINELNLSNKICRIWLLFPLVFIFSTIFLLTATQAKPHKPIITILQIVQHPALDSSAKGLLDELKNQGYIDGTSAEIIYKNAQGNVLLASQISQKFVGLNADIIVTLGTTATQAAISSARNTNIPIIFISVTDPIHSKILKDLKTPEGNVTGVSNLTEIKPQFEMFERILPKLKRLGVVYNPGEANSVRLNELMIIEGKKLGIEIVLSAALKSSEVMTAALKLASTTDAIFVNNDNTALSAFKTIVQAANKTGIPVFVSDTDMLDQGALVALGPNQYELGKQAGKQVARILGGEKVKGTAVEFPNIIELHLNLKAAKTLGLIIHDDIIKQASRVIKCDSTYS